MLDALTQDLRYALRTLTRSPAFTAVALVILALGIGATTAIFSVVDAVLLAKLPYEDPDRLVRIRHAHREHGLDGIGEGGGFSPQDFDNLENGSTSYQQLATYLFQPGNSTANLSGEGTPERLDVAVVSGHFFDLLGRPAAVGRTITPADSIVGKDAVVVLSHAFWQRRFAGDPEIVGRALTFDGKPLEVLGVMPPSFRFPSREVDAWVPVSRITDDMIPLRRSIRWLQVLGRLAPGVSAESAAAETRTLLATLAETYPESNEGWTGAVVTPLQESLVGGVRPALLLLLGATVLVLLVACSNLANLLLARAAGRGREIAVRLSLGAGRGRLLRQLLTESVLLSLAGGVLGLMLAAWSVDFLVSMSAGHLPRAEDIGPDLRMVGFALLASLITGTAFGLIPAWTTTAERPASALRETAANASGGRRQTLRNLLVTGETTLAVLLVIGSGLMLKSLWKLVRVDPGFDTEHVLTLAVRASDDFFQGPDPNARLLAYQREVLDAVERIPEVTAVGASKSAPMASGGEPFAIRARDAGGNERVIRPDSGLQIVTPGYFEALGITVLAGRTFVDRDPPTFVVVNQAMADQYWPGEDAVGELLGTGEQRLEIVGVVADVHHEGMAQATRSTIYVSPQVAVRSQMNLFVRTRSDPLAVADAVRAAIWSVHPDQPIANLAPLSQAVHDDVAEPRFFTTLLAVFAVLALVLAALGIYGVVSYTVGQRTGEIGIRMALGARGGDVLRMVVSQTLRVCLLGLALGLMGAFWLTRLLASQLYGVEPRDPATFAAVAALLLIISLASAVVPARRATRVDPVSALRSE